MSQLKKDSNFLFDIHEMEIDEDGVKDFYWPVSAKERSAFAKSLIEGYFSLLDNYENEEKKLPYIFFAKFFLIEAIAVFNADILKSRLDPGQFPPSDEVRWRLWSSLLQDKQPLSPGFMKKLKTGPNSKQARTNLFALKRLKRIFSILQFGKKGLGVGNLKLKPITQSVLEKDIIATQRTELIQLHAARCKRDVVFCRSDRWFHEIEDCELKKGLERRFHDFEKNLLSFIEGLYKNFGLTFDGISRQHLSELLATGPAMIGIHYSRLLDKPEAIPFHIWTGTGGNIWDSMLRYANLKLHDGEVVGHHHGSGMGHVRFPELGFMELWGCKKFIFLNENQAMEYAEQSVLWPGGDLTFPALEGFSNLHNFTYFEKFQKNKAEVKTIIVLATLYGGDRVWMGPYSPDVVHVDWQARLITKLKEKGYRVILKVHPETAVMPPDVLKDLGAELRSEPLEDMMHEGDLVLFDCVHTTVFRSVLATNTPMVLIDFHGHGLTDKALSMLTKRIGFINAGFDTENRAKVAWEDLFKAVDEAAVKHNNTEFFDYYYA